MPPKITITSPLDNAHIPPGQPVQLTATITDLEPGTHVLDVEVISAGHIEIEHITVVQDAPPPPSALVPVFSSCYGSQQYPSPPAWIDPAKIPAPIPWMVPLSTSQHGVRPTSWTLTHPLGQQCGLYGQQPQLYQGRHEQILVNHGDDPFVIAAALPHDHLTSGMRGNNLVTPYMVWKSHPTVNVPPNVHMPLYIGMDVSGWVYYWHHGEEQRIERVRQIPGASPCFDFTLDRQQRTRFFVACLSGTILTVDRQVAVNAMPPGGTEDPALWQVSTLVSGLGKPTSIRLLPNGDMFIADNIRSKLYRVDVLHRSVTTILDLNGIFWIDYLSDNRLILVANKDGKEMQVFVYDWHSGTLGPNLVPSTFYKFDQPFTNLFLAATVDRNGTVGPIDEFFAGRSHGQGNTDFLHFRKDATAPGGYRMFTAAQTFEAYPPSPYRGGEMKVGSPRWCKDSTGHYDWIFGEVHEELPYLPQGGNSDSVPQILMPTQVWMAPEDTYDTTLAKRGHDVFLVGVAGHEYQYPSLTCFMNAFGGGVYTNCDVMAEMPFLDLIVYLQSGLCGNVARPDLKGYDLLALGYWILRNSQRFLREGKALMDAWRAYMGPQATTPNPKIRLGTTNPPGDVCLVPTATGVKAEDIYRHGSTIEPGVQIQVTMYLGPGVSVNLGTLSAPYTYTLPVLAPRQQVALYAQWVSGGVKWYWSQCAVMVG